MRLTCVLMDIDGTLANAEHRVHLIPRDGTPSHEVGPAWQAFFDRSHLDTVNDEIKTLNNAMHAVTTVFMVTGRPETDRTNTSHWLRQNGIRFNGLFMRPAGDRRPDTVVKKEVLEHIRDLGYEILFAVEDRASVTKMFRENGVRCLQVCEGDY
jgi:hypothetical protein